MAYRISKMAYVRDLTGIGSKLYGGRWSPPGIPIIHTSESRALAALEFYVHLGNRPPLADTSIASIEINDGASARKIAIEDLPSDWKEYPAPIVLYNIGVNWVKSGDCLLMLVPSVQIPQEYNILINPAHPEMKHIKIVKVEKFIYDQRLISRKLKKSGTSNSG